MSGYRRDRPGRREVLRLSRAGEIDVVVCEAIDRIARDGEDVVWIGKKLSFDRVAFHTVTEGEIDDYKIGAAAMMGSIFLKGLRDKTLRGMEARVAAGRFAGGRSYGYRLTDEVDARGERIRGVLEVDPVTAPVVRRIFEDFASGKSAYTIARALNDERVPSPCGGLWNQSTIRGDPSKLVGILHNPLYGGELVWGRREWRRDPDSEKRARRYRLRDEADWLRVGVPELAVVDAAIAARVRAQVERRRRPGVSGNPLGGVAGSTSSRGSSAAAPAAAPT